MGGTRAKKTQGKKTEGAGVSSGSSKAGGKGKDIVKNTLKKSDVVVSDASSHGSDADPTDFLEENSVETSSEKTLQADFVEENFVETSSGKTLQADFVEASSEKNVQVVEANSEENIDGSSVTLQAVDGKTLQAVNEELGKVLINKNSDFNASSHGFGKADGLDDVKQQAVVDMEQQSLLSVGSTFGKTSTVGSAFGKTAGADFVHGSVTSLRDETGYPVHSGVPRNNESGMLTTGLAATGPTQTQIGANPAGFLGLQGMGFGNSMAAASPFTGDMIMGQLLHVMMRILDSMEQSRKEAEQARRDATAQQNQLLKLLQGMNDSLFALKNENAELKQQVASISNATHIPETMKTYHDDGEKDKEGFQEAIETLNEKMEYLADMHERETKANNFRISGLPEGENEDTVVAVHTFLAERMQVQAQVDIVEAYRIGRKGEGTRNILVKCASKDAKARVMQKRSSLKGQHIWINDDLTKMQFQQRKDDIVKMKEARAEGKRSYWRGGKVVIEDA